MAKKEEAYKEALTGKKIPILTLDNKWHRLFTQIDSMPEIEVLSKELNELLKRQGKINTETKDIKKIKKRLMDEIVTLRSNSEYAGNSTLEKKVEENKRLIAECNDKLEAYQEENADLPGELERVNNELMLLTMQSCYDRIQENTQEIQEISQWVSEVRVELKKKLVRKQEKEIINHELYAYMHDIFGADVIELFDMKYNPQENHPKPPSSQD
ncbi:MAG: hypothetical protein IJ282_10640 [Lachnospiraceae bacterium]|nr:hypothetical protein [Lachnospiraceae bacterium]